MLSVLIIAFMTLAGAEIYKWVDDQGKTHYSDKPLEDDAQEIEPEPAPSDENIRQSREEMKSFLERQKQRDIKRKSLQEQKQRDEAASRHENEQRIQRCKIAQEQLMKLNLQRPLYRVDSRGEENFIDAWGQTESPAGERVYITDDQRPVEIRHYESEIRTHCGTIEEQRAIGMELYMERKCKESREHLEMLKKPSAHTPSSDIRNAEGWVRIFCQD